MARRLRVLFLYPNDLFMNMLPPAIGLFSALLKQEGYEVDLFDTTYHRMEENQFEHDKAKEATLQVLPSNMGEKGIVEKTTSAFDDFVQKIESFQPDLIAMSTVEDTFLRGIRLLRHVRHYGIPHLVGGVFPTFAPEKVIAYDCVDMVCVGEGENPLLEVCRRMSRSEDYSDIPGLWVKTENGIKKNLLGPRYSFDDIPVLDFSVFEEARLYRPMAGVVYRMVPVETHRGCPYQCSFCNSPSQNVLHKEEMGSVYFRKRKTEIVYRDLSYYRDVWNIEYVYFTADTFLAWTNREFDEFVEMYSNIRLPFWCQTRPETITPYRMKRLKEVGLHRMSIGCEHGNEKFRREVVKRPVSNEEIIRAFDCAADYEIPTTVNNIVGFPDETRELAFDTIEINRQLKVHSMNCNTFTPFHGTELRKLAIQRGYLDDLVIAHCLLEGSLLKMPQFTEEEIRGILNTFVLYARLDRSRWPAIEMVERNIEKPEIEYLFEELKQEYRERFFTGATVS